MTEQRKNEIERKVLIRRMLEQYEDTLTIFQLEMKMGYLHKSLFDELDKKVELQERNKNE